jgi:predicted ArsR family transcriptional regulator
MDDSPPWPLGPHPGGQSTVGARSLRGLAHPVRMRLLGILRVDGPSTATKLADRLGLASGATSYHLRQLAAYGFIVEDDTHGGGRERWWRAAHQATRLDMDDLDDIAGDAGELTEVYLRSLAAVYRDQVERAINEWLTHPEPWRRAQGLHDFALRMTATELARFKEEVLELVSRYRLETGRSMDAPADSETVTVQFHVFRSPGSCATDEAG